MRISAFLLSIALGLALTARLHGQDPGAQQDAEAAREKLLKASDELDNIQANSEATKTSVDSMKTDVTALQATITQLQTDNAALKQQVSGLQAELDEFKAEQIKARQTLIDNVADMLAASKAASKPAKKKKDETEAAPASAETTSPAHSPDSTSASNLAPPPDAPVNTPPPPTKASSAPAPVDTPPPPKPQKGYYHVVAAGETLTLICEAYRENGVMVTVSQIRKANGLTEGTSLKPGQKLFIPKPGA